MLARPIIALLAILVLAVLNGLFRESILLHGLVRSGAYLASGLILAALVVAVAVAPLVASRVRGALKEET